MSQHVHRSGCNCMSNLSRRGLFGLGVAAAASVASLPAFALDQGYEAMLLKCIDPRFTTNTWAYMSARGWQNLYSQFNIAGGPIGVVAPAFAKWHDTFWENLGISVQLHNVKRVVGITHRDCGAAKIAYGEAKVATREIETETHRAVFAEFRKQMSERQPKLAVETGLMAIDGTIEMLG